MIKRDLLTIECESLNFQSLDQYEVHTVYSTRTYSMKNKFENIFKK